MIYLLSFHSLALYKMWFVAYLLKCLWRSGLDIHSPLWLPIALPFSDFAFLWYFSFWCFVMLYHTSVSLVLQQLTGEFQWGGKGKTGTSLSPFLLPSCLTPTQDNQYSQHQRLGSPRGDNQRSTNSSEAETIVNLCRWEGVKAVVVVVVGLRG